MDKHVTALFYDIDKVSRAIDDLIAGGVDRGDISVLTSETGGARHFGFKSASKTPEGAATGGAIGGAIGLIAGTLVTAASAGVGVLATGPILVGLAGMGTGALVGGLAGALSGLGIPEHEAKLYEREIRDRNAILIGVDTSDYDRDRIESVLSRYETSRHGPA